MKKFILILTGCVLCRMVVNAASWTAKTIEKSKSGDGLLVNLTISFTDGTTTYVKILPFNNATQIRDRVDAYTKLFSSADDLFNSVQIGDIDLTSPPPDPFEVAKAKYFKDLMVLHRYEMDIASGLIDANNQDYIDQKALVNSERKKEYYNP